MPSESSVTCPSCGAALPTSGLTPGVLVQCARCNWQFRLGDALAAPAVIGAPPAPPHLPGSDGTSGLAITSFVLGLVPCFCLTGVPAIFCGAFALSEISREAGRLRGTVWAVLGIILGTVWSLMCAVGVGSAVWLGKTIERNVSFFDDPETVAQTAEGLGMPKVPDGLEPLGGGDSGVFGMRGVLYGDRKDNPNSIIIVVQFPSWIPMERADMEIQTRNFMDQQQNQGSADYQVEETKVVTYKIRDEDVPVTEVIGKDTRTGRRMREYVALLHTGNNPVMVIIHTTEPQDDATSEAAEAATKEPTEVAAKEAEKPPTETGGMPAAEPAAKAVHLTEEQVRQFFESFP